jgi:orotidine-5'-phosphate decarboxylase
MGFDSIEPYQRYANKGLFVLCRTSNPGGSDFQALDVGGEKLFERIARLCAEQWNLGGQLGLVVGATFPAELARVRALAPGLPLLIPGIGAQGGDLTATALAGKDAKARGMLVNSSRAILYASGGNDFAAAAAAVAERTRADINHAIS